MQISKSNNFTEEYCCQVVKIGTCTPVPNSDNLVQTQINGENIVINKNEVHEGDVMLYISNECQINSWFLSKNNLYSDYKLNSNAAEVEILLTNNPGCTSYDKGYFSSNGRVKMIRLRGCPSFGVIFSPKLLDYNFTVGEEFDTIDDEWFVRPYVPERNTPSHPRRNKLDRKINKISRMVPGQFKFHYDTALLGKHLDLFHLNDSISVSVKLHGTSFICGNLLVNYPKSFYKIRKLFSKIFKWIKPTYQDYGMICSSRRVIKNEWIGKTPQNYYSVDLWNEYGNLIYPYIPKGYTVYGEICGYETGLSKMIQKNYDYGCNPGENFLMIYRVTYENKDLDISDVIEFTRKIDCPRIRNIGEFIVYQGQISNIVDNIEELPSTLALLGNIERKEPFCKMKVPREGIVVRIDGDPVAEAFKLKSVSFRELEKKLIDSGVIDTELNNNLQL